MATLLESVCTKRSLRVRRTTMKIHFSILCTLVLTSAFLHSASLSAGIAKVDITDRTAGPVNDPCFAKALVLKSGETTAVLVTVDAVAIGEIGRIGNGFLATVRGRLEKELGIAPASVVINASHCHGIVRSDTAQLVIEVVKEAAKNLMAVKTGSGSGLESRISENRRLNPT